LLGIPAGALSADMSPQDINSMSEMTPLLTLPYWRWFIEVGFGLRDSDTFRAVEPELKSLVE
jgi:hypothetical protein